MRVSIKRVAKGVMWIINYELWRMNAKLTIKTIQQMRAAKRADELEKEDTWGEATNGR